MHMWVHSNTRGHNAGESAFPAGPVVRTCLPTQGTKLQCLVWKDLTCHEATKTVRTAADPWALQPALCLREATAVGSRNTTRNSPVHHTGLPWGLRWYRTCPQCRRPPFNSWVGKIRWRRERLPIPVFWPGESQGLSSPRGHKESDTAKRRSLSLSHHN